MNGISSSTTFPAPEISTIPTAREQEFRSWLKRNNVRDLDAPRAFYDYRGAFLAGVNRGKGGHWPDTFKQHGHPTFSVESQYALPNDPQAGRWNGDKYIPPMLSPIDTIPSFPGAAMLSDADLWEHYRALGLSGEQAQQHVLRRRSARQAVADNPLPPPKVTSPEGAAILGATRTATSGFGDELIGALQALHGPPAQNAAERWGGVFAGKDVSGPLFDTGIYQKIRDQMRELQSQSAAEHPAMTIASGAVGAYANPLNYLLGPATQAMGPVVRGMTTGATLGAAQGAGEGTSGVDRLAQAVQDMAIGATIGGATGVASKLWRAIFQSAPAKITEATVRAQLAKLKFTPEQSDQAVAIWRQGGLLPGGPPKRLPVPAVPPPPPTVRPGETIQPTPNLEKATFLRRGGTVRQDMSPISGNRSMSFDPGKGQTLPWYPRGGQVEQGVAPLPTMSVPTPKAPDQMALFVEYLKQATTPQDALARLGTLRDLGIPTPGDPAQVLSLLFGASR